jgi:inositol oxygenase
VVCNACLVVQVVERHYRMMRENQTMEYVKRMHAKFCWFDTEGKPIKREPHGHMEIWEAFEALGDYVDSSDPDSAFPNIEHSFQTAEGIRAAGYPEWMQLIGLVHDVGKMMFKYGRPEDGHEGTATGCQWALGGDTWVVGCKLPDGACFPEYNELNPDMQDPRYNTEMGIYKAGQGMATLNYAFGHDEYAYQVVKHHRDTLAAKGHPKEDLLPDEGLAMLRYHSCYPWHNKGDYDRFMAPGDEKLKEAVLKFNRFDLYTKADVRPDIPALWPYYQKIIDRFLPGKLAW